MSFKRLGFLVIPLVVLMSGCGVMRSVGGALTEFDGETDGIVGDLAGAAGTVYTTVGCAGASKGNEECEPKK